MKKNLFRWLTVLAVILPCLLISVSLASRSVVDSGYCGGEGDGTNLIWALYDDGVLVVDGSGVMSSSTSMPWYAHRENIKTVIIRDGVTTIGKYAFWNCTNLTSVTIPDGVIRIGSKAFYGCIALNSVAIPDSVTNIDGGAFWRCDSLTRVMIGKSVTNIGNYAFYECPELVAVYYAGNVADWCSISFENAEASPMYHAEKLYIDDCLVSGELIIPDGVTSIGSYAFMDCASLTSVTMPDSVTKIGYAAFEGCTSLNNMTIPDSVTNIQDYAFYGCTGLVRIECLGNEPKANSHIFSLCHNLTIYYRQGTMGWLDSVYYDTETHTWCGRPLVMIAGHTITVGAVANGTVTVDKTSGEIGETVTITATPDDGYVLKSIQVNGEDIEGSTFALAGNCEVTAVFARVVKPGDVMYFPGDPVGKEYVEGYLVSSDTPNRKIFFYFEGGFAGK